MRAQSVSLSNFISFIYTAHDHSNRVWSTNSIYNNNKTSLQLVDWLKCSYFNSRRTFFKRYLILAYLTVTKLIQTQVAGSQNTWAITFLYSSLHSHSYIQIKHDAHLQNNCYHRGYKSTFLIQSFISSDDLRNSGVIPSKITGSLPVLLVFKQLILSGLNSYLNST